MFKLNIIVRLDIYITYCDFEKILFFVLFRETQCRYFDNVCKLRKCDWVLKGRLPSKNQSAFYNDYLLETRWLHD